MMFVLFLSNVFPFTSFLFDSRLVTFCANFLGPGSVLRFTSMCLAGRMSRARGQATDVRTRSPHRPRGVKECRRARKTKRARDVAESNAAAAD
ncbi:hypothetical protein DFH11DRAFT_1637572 [Phellopilus nigrolimitatus]|nr:hypothetical protein DFH11DRAFT_1637572 [Phellopilus nigrolimitatus]